jgi:PAS domain S-box-containing protein
MKRYVRFEAGDERLLARLRPFAAPHFPRIAVAFYDRIREHEATHALFTGEAQYARLHLSLVRWMDRICAGPHDEAYFQESARVGRIHVRLGLPQRYMFTAMSLMHVALERIADESMGEDAPGARAAITRALDLELAIMLETYQERFVERLHDVDRLEPRPADRALQLARQRYVDAVELARVLIIGVDAHGTILLFNHEAERITGFARDEVLGRPFAEAFSGGGADAGATGALGAEMKAILAGGALVEPAANETVEAVIATRTGMVRDVRCQLAHAPEGELHDEVAVFVIGRDVTEENALAARVRKSERLAAVGTLAAGLAHEIRNPLNGAQLHLKVLERALHKGSAGPDAGEAVQVIRGEIKRLSTLVTEFLDFAQPGLLDRRPTSLGALCERTLTLLASQAEAAHVRLDCHLPTVDPIADLDPGRIEQALVNLVQNAIEALDPTGGGVVVLRVLRLPGHVSIEVEDDGPGISNSEAPIFDPFYSTKPSGTGLGLAIVHRIVTDHDGSVEVRSAPGKTTFQITLPLGAAIHPSTARLRSTPP